MSLISKSFRWLLALSTAAVAFVSIFVVVAMILGMVLASPAEISHPSGLAGAIVFASALMTALVAWVWVGSRVLPHQNRYTAIRVLSVPEVVLTVILILVSALDHQDLHMPLLALGALLACVVIAVMAKKTVPAPCAAAEAVHRKSPTKTIAVMPKKTVPAPHVAAEPVHRKNPTETILAVGRVAAAVTALTLSSAGTFFSLVVFFGRSGHTIKSFAFALSVVCMSLLLACVILSKSEQILFRFARERWTELPALIVHRCGWPQKWIQRFGFILVLGIFPHAISVYGNIFMRIIALSLYAAFFYFLVTRFGRLWRFEREIAVDRDGVRLSTDFWYGPRNIPWSEIISVKFSRSRTRYNQDFLVLTLKSPELFGITPSKHWLLRLLESRVRGKLMVNISTFLERPRYIFEDVRAFHARYHEQGEKPGPGATGNNAVDDRQRATAFEQL